MFCSMDRKVLHQHSQIGCPARHTHNYKADLSQKIIQFCDRVLDLLRGDGRHDHPAAGDPPPPECRSAHTEPSSVVGLSSSPFARATRVPRPHERSRARRSRPSSLVSPQRRGRPAGVRPRRRRQVDVADRSPRLMGRTGRAALRRARRGARAGGLGGDGRGPCVSGPRRGEGGRSCLKRLRRDRLRRHVGSEESAWQSI